MGSFHRWSGGHSLSSVPASLCLFWVSVISIGWIHLLSFSFHTEFPFEIVECVDRVVGASVSRKQMRTRNFNWIVHGSMTLDFPLLNCKIGSFFYLCSRARKKSVWFREVTYLNRILSEVNEKVRVGRHGTSLEAPSCLL